MLGLAAAIARYFGVNSQQFSNCHWSHDYCSPDEPHCEFVLWDGQIQTTALLLISEIRSLW